MSYIYLASPYSHETKAIEQQRYEQVSETVVMLLRANLHVYSPIVHCHELASRFNLSGSFSFWKDYNFAMLEPAVGIFVLKLEGWKGSKGVRAEMDYASTHGIELTTLSYPLKFQYP